MDRNLPCRIRSGFAFDRPFCYATHDRKWSSGESRIKPGRHGTDEVNEMVTAVVIVALIACLIGAVWISRGIRLVEYASNRTQSTFSQILFTILGSLVGGWMFFGLCAVGPLRDVCWLRFER